MMFDTGSCEFWL